NSDRALRPERVLPTARIAADSLRDERILPGSERACARELPRRHGGRQPPPRGPVEEQPGRFVRPCDRVIDREAADLVGLILRLHEDELHEPAGLVVEHEHVVVDRKSTRLNSSHVATSYAV